MTSEQLESFMRKVKGKPIRWHEWPATDMHFIPRKRYGSVMGQDSMLGTTYKNGEVHFETRWFVSAGYPDTIDGSGWNYAYDVIAAAEVLSVLGGE